MNQKRVQKVAIVGAGTIGLYLAWKLSTAEHNVTVFEKNKEIEEKSCSGLISERLINFIRVDDALIENKIKTSQIYFPKKTITLNFKLDFFVINRRKLNEKLSSLAKESGAKILFGQSIKEIPEKFDKIIGCDGALSKIRESLSLPQPSFRLGIQFFLPIKDSSDRVESWPIKDGFFWKIPRGTRVEYGALGPPSSIQKEFKKFCQNRRINFNQGEIKSALIPQGLTLPKNNNITLCGDAAGLTKPWSGGGIIWGMTAADILIKNFPDFNDYYRKMKTFFGPKIFLGNLSKKLVYFGGKNLPFLMPKRVSVDNDFLLE